FGARDDSEFLRARNGKQRTSRCAPQPPRRSVRTAGSLALFGARDDSKFPRAKSGKQRMRRCSPQPPRRSVRTAGSLALFGARDDSKFLSSRAAKSARDPAVLTGSSHYLMFSG